MQLLDDLYFFFAFSSIWTGTWIYINVCQIYIYMKRERKRRYCRSLIEISPSFVLDFLFEKSIVCLNLNKVKVSKILQIKLILVLFFLEKKKKAERWWLFKQTGLMCLFFLSFDVTGEKEKKKEEEEEERADGHDERANRKLMYYWWKQKHRHSWIFVI